MRAFSCVVIKVRLNVTATLISATSQSAIDPPKRVGRLATLRVTAEGRPARDAWSSAATDVALELAAAVLRAQPAQVTRPLARLVAACRSEAGRAEAGRPARTEGEGVGADAAEVVSVAPKPTYPRGWLASPEPVGTL